ncbi:MAG: S9 family peptidase [Lentisphaeria bacterium]|nr:S9 family peptidase [Lentisphaeria bacterium]
MLHTILHSSGFVMLCMVFFLLCGCEASFTSLHDYDKNNGFLFDSRGNIINLNDYVPPVSQTSNIKVEITERGEYKVVWKDFSCLGAPGERVFPVHESGEYLYLLTEKDSDYMQLMVWDRKRKIIHRYPHGNREAESIIVSGSRLHGIQYAGDVFARDYFTPEFQEMDRKLKSHYHMDNLLWREHSPDGRQWLVELFFCEKPSLTVLCDIRTGKWRELSEPCPYKPDLTQKKEVFRFITSDGQNVSGILSFPPIRFGTRNLPLVVFPHGGPQARSMLVFDPRVEQLTRNGFLVFQPNYRGSTGQGKRFRQAGWGVKGITRALADIAEGTENLIKKGYADRDRIAILGGSWGGYCALASAMLYPDLFRAVTVFFGPSDLVGMLHEFLPESGANPYLDHLQYGDINDPVVAEKLKKISPVYNVDKIQAPVLMYHFQQDTVISIQQSERFVNQMKASGREISFFSGPGKHSFPDSAAEASAYDRAIVFFREAFRK